MDETAERPLWHPIGKQLYWGDITEGESYRYDSVTGRHELVFDEGQMFGGYTFQADGSILMSMEEGRIGVLRDGKLDIIIDGLRNEQGNRFIHVIADPRGRVLCGQMRKNPAKAIAGKSLRSLYRLDVDGTITKILGGIAIPNGLGFTPDSTGMYHTDTPTGAIQLFDYDHVSGVIGNKRDFVRAGRPDTDGLPDGMTVDAEAYVWSARVLAGQVHRYSPAGKRALSIDLPCDMVSNVTFGREAMDELYVTTISDGDRAIHGSEAGVHLRLPPALRASMSSSPGSQFEGIDPSGNLIFRIYAACLYSRSISLIGP